MTTYEQRILGSKPKNENYGETVFTAILMIVAFAMVSGIIYLVPHALK